MQQRDISRGLENPTGARCYLNSVVIALLHFPKFYNWLTHHVYCHGVGESCVACVLAELAIQYWSDGIQQSDLETAIDRFTKVIVSGKLFDLAISSSNADFSSR